MKTPLLQLLLVLMCSCYYEDHYLDKKLNFDDAVALTSDFAVLPADGITSTFITATLPLESKSGLSVTFTTNRGTFENGNKSIIATTAIKFLNGENRMVARAQLTSSTKVETATVQASVTTVLKSLNVPFVHLKYDTLLAISSSVDSIPADGKSTGTITAIQPINVTDEYSSITFSTTAGVFENNAKSITKSTVVAIEAGAYIRKAVATLVSSKDVEKAKIDVGIKNSIQTLEVNFSKAFPDSLRLETSALTISPGYSNSITLTLTLIRSTGVPTRNTKADVRVYNSDNVEIGKFINYLNTSNELGVIINKFTLGDTNYHGLLKCVATSFNDKNELISVSTNIISP